MIIQQVRFTSGLPEAEVVRVMEERAPEYEKVPGLIQKFYVKDIQTGAYAGIYLWDSLESLQRHRQSELVGTIAQAYRIQGAPRVEIYQVEKVLRPEQLPSP